MNIAVLTRDVPATPGMPGSPRLFSLCRELARHHRLVLLCGGRDERWQWFLNSPELPGVFASVQRLPDPPSPRWTARQHHRLRLACHMSTRYRAPRYHRHLQTLIADHVHRAQADLLYVDGLDMTQYLDNRPGIPLTVDLHDCLTLLYERAARQERHWWKRLAVRLETRSISRWERSLAPRFRLIVTNSAVDEAYLRRLAPLARSVTLTNGVDCDYFSAGLTTPAAHRMVFTGVMSYGPNEDAALYYAHEILPRIRAAVPTAEFWIVGADPSPAVRRLGTLEAITVTGSVPDIRPYVQGAGVSVCPLRYGAGMKNKVLAAMAMCRPVVSTTVGLEGIDATPGQDVLCADTAKDFADNVVRILTTEGLAQRLGRCGHNLVRERYSWAAIARQLDGTLRRCLHEAGA